MPNATVTLATTSFARPVEVGDRIVTLADVSNIVVNEVAPIQLFVDGELMSVEKAVGVANQFYVYRGDDGTVSSRHATNATVYIGRSDQFYNVDPVGLPPNELPVYPYINVRNGSIWTAEGDESGPGLQGRIWSRVTRTIDAGALGINQPNVVTPS
jgi:hypothetical protein